jgi:hypothetical protein
MSVLVEHLPGDSGERVRSGRAAPAAHPAVFPAPVRRRRGEPLRPPTRTRVVAGRRPPGVVRCAPQPAARHWWALAVVAVAICVGMVGLGLLASTLAAQPVPERTEVVSVAPGDTLWELAGLYAPGSDPESVVERIRELNGLRVDTLLPGSPVLVPYEPASSY